MDMRIPHHKTKILLHSNPLKSRTLVRKLVVFRETQGDDKPTFS